MSDIEKGINSSETPIQTEAESTEEPFAWEETEIPELPGKKVLRGEITIGGQSREELMAKLGEYDEHGNLRPFDTRIDVRWGVMEMLEDVLYSKEFNDLQGHTEKIKIVALRARDLGCDEDWSPVKEVFERAIKKGLKLCPAITGLNLRLEYKEQPEMESCRIATKQIRVRHRKPAIFELERDEGGLDLKRYEEWTELAFPEWPGNDILYVFGLPERPQNPEA